MHIELCTTALQCLNSLCPGEIRTHDLRGGRDDRCVTPSRAFGTLNNNLSANSACCNLYLIINYLILGHEFIFVYKNLQILGKSERNSHPIPVGNRFPVEYPCLIN
jgi:hypothetical protein